MRWAETQEREFRVFASDGAEKRLRFKPMPAPQRAFLHALAEDYGLDSESQDPEPHRHVCIFKTPRFVSAPPKTLAQCIKIRNAQAAARPTATGTASTGPSSPTLASAAPSLPFNALLLTNPRFALTIEELESALASDLSTHKTLAFTTSFLPSDQVLIRAAPVTSWGSTPAAVEAALSSLKPSVARTISREGLAGAVRLVHADGDLNVLRREADGAGAGHSRDGSGGGWSAVVGRAAAKPRSVQPPSSTARGGEGRPASGFVSFSKAPRKKLVQEGEAEEDWEAAAEKMDSSAQENGAVDD